MRKRIRGTNKFIDEDGYIYSENGKRYSRWVDNVGYYQSCFQENKIKRYLRIHRLIAEYFIPNPNNYNQVNHIDGNKLNNYLDNLKWVTKSENTRHAYDNNLYKSKYRCPVIAKNKADGSIQEFKSIRECASVLGLNRKTITSILKKEKRNNYGFDFEYDV